jgi:hypothetical protein
VVSHRKTTLNLRDDLLRRAKDRARRERTTLRALVEEGLRLVLSGGRVRAGRYRLPSASVKGKGLHPALRSGSWDEIRSLTYEGRGA